MTKARILADYVAGGTTAAEFDYMDGVTSNVQTQMNTKAPLASPTFTGTTTVSGDLVPSTPLSSRNMIINGAMQVSQRGTSEASISGTSSGYKNAPDRMRFATRETGTWTVSQSTEAPEGFSNSYKYDNTTADASLDANSYLMFSTKFEGQDLQHLKYGTSNAETTTLSFYVRSAKTGTYIVELENIDSTNKHICQAYTIGVADTWERKTLTFAGDTAIALDNDNNSSLQFTWWLASGTDYNSGTLATSWAALSNANRAVGVVNLGDSTSNDWHITGIQWELGSNATPFEHRSYADELARCQRYCWTTGDSGYGAQGVTSALTSDSYHRSRFFSPQTCRHKTQALTATLTDWGATSGNSTFAFYTSLTIVTSGAGVNSQDVSGRLDAGSGGHSVLWPLNETDGTSPLIFDCEL